MTQKLPALQLTTTEKRKNSYNPSDDEIEESELVLPQKGKKRRNTSHESCSCLVM